MEPHLLQTLPAEPILALLVVFAAGLLSVATPCVLPMVPITLGTLGVTRATTRGRALLTAAAYMAGIVLTFTVLGTAFALSGRMLGSLMAHPATAIALAALFIALALSSFGLINFRLPDRLTQAAAKVGGHGPLGAFAAGLVAGVIAAPCIGPVLAAILSYVSTTRDAVWGAALLASYGAGFGLPFLIVGAFALRLPKSGPWMEAVKGLFGIALLLGAYWFLRGAFPALRGTGSLSGGATELAIGTIGYVILASLRNVSRFLRALRPVAVGLAVLGGVYVMNALLVPTLTWCAESPEASCLPVACEGRERTIVLFTAEWCPSCHELESVTLRDPRVIDRLQRYGKIIVDVDRNPEVADQAEIRGIPTMIFLNGDCEGFDRATGYRGPEDFIRLLDGVERR